MSGAEDGEAGLPGHPSPAAGGKDIIGRRGENRGRRGPQVLNPLIYPFRNLVFEGGGVKGIAYVGAMEVLAGRGILERIERVAGTSAGAINAVLVGLGYGPAETRRILDRLDFRSFLDDSWGVARDILRLQREYGWNRGDFFRDWIAGLVAAKTGDPESTFRQVRARRRRDGFRDIYLVGTNLSTGFAEVFSHEHSPDLAIADAARVSMSIPLFFAARRNRRGDVLVDGGVLDNYPVKLFDREKYLDPKVRRRHARRPGYYRDHNRRLRRRGARSSPWLYNAETLGFRLDSAREIDAFRDRAAPVRREIDDFFSYARALIGTLMNCQTNQHLHSDDWQRTIYIDSLGVGTTDFELSGARKRALVRSGRRHTECYFEWYDDPASRPVNRPAAGGGTTGPGRVGRRARRSK